MAVASEHEQHPFAPAEWITDPSKDIPGGASWFGLDTTNSKVRRAWETEKKVLDMMRVPYQQLHVPVNKKEQYMHTIEMKPGTKADKTLVILHGYGSGACFWFKTLEFFGSMDGLKVYSVDWLGKGSSSRPHFPTWSPEKGEAFFIDALENWRIQMGIDRMILSGHSLGGYLVTCYALKYPMRVEKLVLVSPVGIPEKPKVLFPQIKTAKARMLVGLMRVGWGMNITPGWILRSVTEARGRSIVDTYVQSRFLGLKEHERQIISDYMYAISVLPGSSEYCMNSILQAGAYARQPLINRIEDLDAPVTFLYGEVDWMDSSWGEKALEVMKGDGKVHTVPRAGHQLFLDNPLVFNELLASELCEHFPEIMWSDQTSEILHTERAGLTEEQMEQEKEIIDRMIRMKNPDPDDMLNRARSLAEDESRNRKSKAAQQVQS
eukprot:Clim_evm12s11 gene=Clim_evmTU12s11